MTERVRTVAIRGYRSLRDVVLPLGGITVITGANGSGKSSLFRALGLLAATAEGRLVPALAAEGGLPAVLWAGPETVSGAMRRGEVPVQGSASRARPVSLDLGFATDTWGYLVDVGLPQPRATLFVRDPVIKREAVFAAPVLRPAGTLVSRTGPLVLAHEGRRTTPLDQALDERLSMVGDLAGVDGAPELREVRRHVRAWRFHDSFRVDAAAPARRPHVGTWTPTLAPDGADLAPAVQTILESGGAAPFTEAIEAAFPGSRVAVVESAGEFRLTWEQPGMLRRLDARELSDGTLRYLLLAAALLGPRPPSLLVLNEPEASLHPDVLPGLAGLVAAAAGATQVVVVSHAPALVDALARRAGNDLVHHELVKELGETRIAGQGLLTRPAWEWGRR